MTITLCECDLCYLVQDFCIENNTWVRVNTRFISSVEQSLKSENFYRKVIIEKR